MGAAGALFRLLQAGVYALEGETEMCGKALDKSERALKRPPLCETGDFILR